MQYMLQIFSPAIDDWDRVPEDEKNSVMGEYEAISASPGVLAGAQLHPAETATTVRVNGGGTLTTDGPFAETKEALGGYYLVDAPDLDAAIALAARIPAARLGARSRFARWWSADRGALP